MIEKLKQLGGAGSTEQVVMPQTSNSERQIKTGDSVEDCEICPDMVLIPGGVFQMGSNKGADDEKPIHSASIKSFKIGRAEVAQELSQLVMGENQSTFKNCGGDCPVDTVCWDDDQLFIQGLNQKTGKHYRLPSEAEWEYACRPGMENKYCGGDDANAVSWYENNSNKPTHPVAQKKLMPLVCMT